MPKSRKADSRERYENDLMEMKSVFNYVNVDWEVEIKRRNYSPEKVRTMIVEVPNKHFRRQILLSVHKFRKYEKKVYVSEELNTSEQILENRLLRKGRELIKEAFSRKTYNYVTSSYSASRVKSGWPLKSTLLKTDYTSKTQTNFLFSMCRVSFTLT